MDASFIIVVLIVIIAVVICKRKKKLEKYIWLYWENPAGKEKPYHIQLCHDLVKKFNPDSKVIILNQDTVHKFVDLPRGWYNLKHIAHKADYVRVALLYKYGGIYLDSDMISLDSLDRVFDLLKKHSFVGFEYRDPVVKNGKVIPRPKYKDGNTYRVYIAFLAVRPKSLLFKKWLEENNRQLVDGNQDDWHFIGRRVMNPLLRRYTRDKRMTYYAFHTEKTVTPITLKNKKKWYSTELPVEGTVVKDTYQPFITLFNSRMPELKKIDRDNFEKNNWLICRVLRYGLEKSQSVSESGSVSE